MFEGFLIDVQGTLISDEDKTPISGACEFIDRLNELKIPYCVVTNNTKEKSEDFLKFLQSLGLHVECYLDPFMILDDVLEFKEVEAFGPQAFKDVLLSKGYELSSPNPKAILIASHTDFSATDFAKMIELVSGGAKIVGMHGTSIYKKNGRKYAGVGAILELLKYATGRDGVVVGKPSDAFYKKALQSLKEQKNDIDFSKCCMISDDAKGDLLGAKDFGLHVKLVLSGKVSSEKELSEELLEKLDGTYENIAQVAKEIW